MIIIPISFDLNEFKNDLKIFKKSKHSGSYVDSMDFELSVHTFWNQIEDKIKEHFENKGMDENQIEMKVQKTLQKIKNSPAGFSLNKFGLGEFLKNAAEPELGVNQLQFFIILNEEKAPLAPDGVIMLAIDNGIGFPESYLNKDTEKKQGLANVRVIKDPGYVEGKIENNETMIERKKTISTKSEKEGSFGGKGIGLEELAKAVSLYQKDHPKKILGRMLAGNIDDFNKSSFKSLISETEDFKLPKQGAVIILHSPYYSDELIKSCEDSFSTRYKDFIKNLDLAEKAEKDSEMELDSPPPQQALSVTIVMPKTPRTPFLFNVPKSPGTPTTPRTPLTREARNEKGKQYLRRQKS
jgi:hypothetical protein